MIFSQKDLNFSILDVMAFESGNVVCHNKKRSYCALSLRIKSDAQIIHKGKVTNLSDGAVTYFPAETDYIRKSKYDKLIAVHLNVQNYISYEIQSVKPENSDEIYSIFNDMLTVWTQKKQGINIQPAHFYTSCSENSVLSFQTTRQYRTVSEAHLILFTKTTPTAKCVYRI